MEETTKEFKPGLIPAIISVSCITMIAFFLSYIQFGLSPATLVPPAIVIGCCYHCYRVDQSAKNDGTKRFLIVKCLFVFIILLFAWSLPLRADAVMENSHHLSQEIIGMFPVISLILVVLVIPIDKILFPLRKFSLEELSEPYTETLVLPIPYGTAFDAGRKSIQLFSDAEIADADRESGVIHASRRNKRDAVTINIEKISTSSARITAHAVSHYTTDMLPGFIPITPDGENKKTVKTITGFLEQQAGGHTHEMPAAVHATPDPVAIRQYPKAIDDTSVKGIPPVLDKAGLTGSVTHSPVQKINPGYWFIAAGIALIIAGLYADWTIQPGMFDGTFSYDMSRHPDSDRIPPYGELIFPLMPGIFALWYGIRSIMNPPPAGTTDTDPASPTGISIGEKEFYRGPAKAATCSLLVPGLGQAYNGRADLGLLLAFAAGGGLLIGLIPGILVWAYAVWEAYTTAERINREEVPAAPFQGTMALFIAAIFIPCLFLTLFLFSQYGPAVALGLNFSTLKGP